MRYDINPFYSRAEGTYRTEGISHTTYISQIRQDLYRGAFAPYLPLAISNLPFCEASGIRLLKANLSDKEHKIEITLNRVFLYTL